MLDNNQTMKTPFLATIYRILGLLGFIAGVLCTVISIAQPELLPAGLMTGVIAILSGIISLGISEVITLIAKIEYNTASNTGSDSEKTMREISTTLKSLLQTTKSTSDLPPVPGSEKFFIAIDGVVDGPYKRTDVIELRSKGALDDAAFYIQERGKDWKNVSEL
jgi:hypothetical protein